MTEIVIEQKVYYNLVVYKLRDAIFISQTGDGISIEHENLSALISALQQLNENTK